MITIDAPERLPLGYSNQPAARARRIELPRAARRPVQLLLAEAARPVRFVLVGGVCAIVQLALLIAITRLGVHAIAANTAAYLISAQLNFALSDLFIWYDRRTEQRTDTLVRRWLSFHASIAGTFLLNEVVFVVARLVLPDVIAAATGIGIAAFANFIIQDALTFR